MVSNRWVFGFNVYLRFLFCADIVALEGGRESGVGRPQGPVPAQRTQVPVPPRTTLALESLQHKLDH